MMFPNTFTLMVLMCHMRCFFTRWASPARRQGYNIHILVEYMGRAQRAEEARPATFARCVGHMRTGTVG